MGVYTMVAVAMGKARFGPMAAKFPLRTLPGLAGAEVGRQQRGTKGKFDKYLSSFIFHSCVVSKMFDCLRTMGLKAMLAT